MSRRLNMAPVFGDPLIEGTISFREADCDLRIDTYSSLHTKRKVSVTITESPCPLEECLSVSASECSSITMSSSSAAQCASPHSSSSSVVGDNTNHYFCYDFGYQQFLHWLITMFPKQTNKTEQTTKSFARSNSDMDIRRKILLFIGWSHHKPNTALFSFVEMVGISKHHHKAAQSQQESECIELSDVGSVYTWDSANTPLTHYNYNNSSEEAHTAHKKTFILF